MKWLCGGLIMAMASVGLMANGQDSTSKPEEQVTVHDLDRQIHFLQDNIEKYNGLANTFDRKAGSLQSHDYTGSRDAAIIRDECRGIARDLESHLSKLEAKRAEMLEQQKQTMKPEQQSQSAKK